MSWLTLFHNELTNFSYTKPRMNPEVRGENLPDLVSFPRYHTCNSEFLRERHGVTALPLRRSVTTSVSATGTHSHTEYDSGSLAARVKKKKSG